MSRITWRWTVAHHPSEHRPELVAAAEFSSIRARADQLVPASILKDNTAFFRRGRPDAAAELLGEAELRRYRSRVEQRARPS
jgi:hypothetical protein